MSVAMAFVRRDALIWSSYRTSLVAQILSLLAMMLLVYFIGNTVNGDTEELKKYGSDYGAFLLSGLVLTDFFTRGLNSLPGSIRQNQQNGTLEPMLVAPIRLFDLVVASSIFGFLQSGLRVILLLTLGVVLFGYWKDANLLSLIVVLIPGSVALFALAILFAAFVVLVKQADSFITAYGAMAAVVGGLVFPVETLPRWLQPLSWVFPLSHALTGSRLALHGEPPSEVVVQAAVLAAIAVVLLPLSILAFNWSVQRAKHEGSLVEY